MSPVDFGACMIKLKMTGGDGCLPQGSMMEARLSLPMTLFPFLTFPNQKTNLIPTLRMGRPHRMLGLGLYISWLFVWHPAPYLSLDKICSCVFIHDYQINVTLAFCWLSVYMLLRIVCIEFRRSYWLILYSHSSLQSERFWNKTLHLSKWNRNLFHLQRHYSRFLSFTISYIIITFRPSLTGIVDSYLKIWLIIFPSIERLWRHCSGENIYTVFKTEA